MQNIYVTSSHLHSIGGFIFLQDITIQDIHKANLKKELLEMVTTISKHNINKDKEKHCLLKSSN
jgi:hypothetical protein